MFRAIYEGKNTTNRWSRWTNEEVETLYTEPKIILRNKVHRLGWQGHKMILHQATVRVRRKEIPWRRRLDSGLLNVQELEIQNWREKAKDREGKRRITAESLQ